jgi:hypothetical protein
MFIEPGGNIYLIEANLQATRLGYSEWILGMDQNRILMDYDPIHKEFYISDGSINYVYTETGLCRGPSMPSKLHAFGGNELSSIKFATGDPTTMDIETTTFTSPSGGLETMTAIDIVGLNASTNGMVLKIKSRCKQTEDFYESAAITLDGRTRAVVDIPYMQYRVRLTAAVATGVTVENIKVETATGLNYGIDAKLGASVPSAATE